MQKKRAEHYVNNKEFLEHMIVFKDMTAAAREQGESDPRIPDVLGEIFVKIASHLSFKSNFINYGFREDMIADGIENCIQYIHNFDPDKSKNPFAYFTQIIYYAFLRRIQKEKKQLYVRYKTLENSQIVNESSGQEDRAMSSSIGIPQLYDNMREFIETYEESMKKKKEIKSKQRKTIKKKKKGSTTSNSVLQFAIDNEEE
tara:strand:- start:1922 stop:2524 length:603 start_codon:yes stop_codon:yes gene_type:complete